FPAGQPVSGVGTGIEAPFALPSSGPPGYSAINQPSIHVIPQDRPRNAYRRRFRNLFACAVFLLLHTLHVLQKKQFNWTRSTTGVGLDKCFDEANWERVWDVPGNRVHLRTSMTFPLTANILSIITEGTRAHGSLEVSQTADAGSDAIVEIDVFYLDQLDFGETTVCRLHPANDEWGLGIFTPMCAPPHHGDSMYKLHFEVHLRLPAATPQPLTIVRLKTDLHDFSQWLHLLADSVHIDKLSLRSTNGRIVVDSVAGDHLELHTTNGAIVGQFNTTADLNLHSTNGHIDAKVSLLPNLPGGNGGLYYVTTTASNAPIDLAFVDAPPDHALTASAQTSNGHVGVTTHKTFEGSFDLSTTNARALTVMARNVRDPAGRGRSAVYGNVWWGEENKDRGSVSVSTSNWGVLLQI
ncbi:hypothetical protein V8D89_001075, partial [Ganoderma adspersum]